MIYEKQTFIDYETVLKAEHLNHIEDGLYHLSNTLDGVESGYDIAKKNGFEGTEEEWLESLKGAKGDKGEKGDTGATGATGADGYTPQKGVDYWTETDKAEIVDDVVAEVPLIKVAEQPTFVNSVDEMTDTSKVYVMPDGYIYAYMTKTVTTNPTNQIKVSIESDGTLYNGGQGWKTGYRLNSSGAEVALESYKVTGFMPAKFGDTLRFKEISSGAVSNTKFAFYDASFTLLNVLVDTPVVEALTNGIYAITDNLESYGLKKSIEDMAYIRLSVSIMSDASVVTINEPLEASTTTTQGWFSTGLAFVPADYEDRIINLEDRASSLENRVDELSIGDSGTFTYIAEEAERVADIVQSKRTVGSLTFTAMSDFHVEVDTEVKYGSYDVKDNLTSCRDAGLGLAEFQKHFKLDFAAVLGDYTWGDKAETIEQVKKDLTYVKNCMVNGMKDIPNIWCTGNHDINYGAETDRRMTEDEMYAYVTSNNKGTTQDGDNIGRNYGYIDFENQKIRCIYLNTVDSLDYPDNTDGTADDALEITAIQAQWLIDTGLDLSDKIDAEKWGFIFLSHHCLCQFMHITAILTAYKDGTSGNVDVTTNGVTTNVNYDFTTTTRGEIICAIHGHDHNFNYRKISDEPWYAVTEANAWLWSIGVPNVDIARNNEKATNEDEAYKQAFGEFDAHGNPVYYPKTQGTATSTSFCVVTIDRKNRKVHAIAYGAGIDREVNY